MPAPSTVDPIEDPDPHAADGSRESRPPPDSSDPRFTFANERTYLAWSRTALALIGGGLAVAEFLHTGLAGAQLIVAVPMIGLGAFLSHHSYRQWQRNQRALRSAEPLPYSELPRVLAYGLGAFAAAAIALAIIHFAS